MIVLLSRLYELLYASEAIASYEYTVKATTIYPQGAMLAPIRLTNEARAASASHSGETQGDASPPPIRTSPAPTRFYRTVRESVEDGDLSSFVSRFFFS